MTWTSVSEYNKDHSYNRVLLKRDDGKILITTWWPADGSAQCEADEMRRRFETKERKLAEKKQREIENEKPDWDQGECSCHISAPCWYCENGDFKEP
jgi:hypothetical protein